MNMHNKKSLDFPLHTGGYKIQLLDEDQSFKSSLTTPGAASEEEEEWMDTDPTAQAHTVTIPRDAECKGCTVG